MWDWYIASDSMKVSHRWFSMICHINISSNLILNTYRIILIGLRSNNCSPCQAKKNTNQFFRNNGLDVLCI